MADEPKEQTWDARNRSLRDSIQWLTESLNAAQQENEALKAKVQDARASMQELIHSLRRKIEVLEADNRELAQALDKERRETLWHKEVLESDCNRIGNKLTAQKGITTKLKKQIEVLKAENQVLRQGTVKTRPRATYRGELYAPVIRQYSLD